MEKDDSFKEGYFGPGIVRADVSLPREELICWLSDLKKSLFDSLKALSSSLVFTGFLSNRINIGTGGIDKTISDKYKDGLRQAITLIEEMEKNFEQFIPDKLKGSKEC